LKRQIIDLNLTDNIILAGQKKDGWQYLPALDIYVCSSVKEGFPYSLLEALAAGLPIISTNVGGIPEIITDGTNGLLVAAADSQALATKLELLVNDKSWRQQLTAGAKSTAQKFSLPEMIKQTSELY